MDQRPVGFFDSGLGGLTAVSAFLDLLPEESIIYFGDTGRCPYGTRPRSQLRRMTQQNLDFLADLNCKVILAACGTMSANSTDILDAYPVPVVNVLRPAAKAMAEIPGNRPLAVIATEASIASGAFEAEIRSALDSDRKIISLPTQNFVSLCESGHISRSDPELIRTVREYLEPVKEADAAAILLGCTHFGIISDAISDYLGPDIQIISAAECAAKAVAEYLREKDILGTGASSRYITSGSAEIFDRSAETVLGNKVKALAEHMEPMQC